jgi:hypothetical protein
VIEVILIEVLILAWMVRQERAEVKVWMEVRNDPN